MSLERDYEIAEAATEGPWKLAHDGYASPFVKDTKRPKDGHGHRTRSVLEGGWRRRGHEAEGDLAFAAHFDPSRVHKLLDVLKAAQKVRWNEPYGNLTDVVARTELRNALDAYEENADD